MVPSPRDLGFRDLLRKLHSSRAVCVTNQAFVEHVRITFGDSGCKGNTNYLACHKSIIDGINTCGSLLEKCSADHGSSVPENQA